MILRGGKFRQTGIPGMNIVVGTVLGILSGKYIFEEPLQHYWYNEKQRLAAEAEGSSSSSPNGGPAGATPSNNGGGGK